MSWIRCLKLQNHINGELITVHINVSQNRNVNNKRKNVQTERHMIVLILSNMCLVRIEFLWLVTFIVVNLTTEQGKILTAVDNGFWQIVQLSVTGDSAVSTSNEYKGRQSTQKHYSVVLHLSRLLLLTRFYDFQYVFIIAESIINF